jgi:hypothetical protein
MFARYAFPPNERGYCGPDDGGEALRTAASSAMDEVATLAQSFSGAWPYLEFIARQTGARHTLDPLVVEAYWLGVGLDIDFIANAASLVDRLGPQAGWSLEHLDGAIEAGALPNHSFHVFEVYPWVGLLEVGRPEALEVLDRCRIRWGKVVAVDGDQAIVESQLLTWEDRTLGLGSPTTEEVRIEEDELGLQLRPEPGDWVALHWDWLCDILTTDRLSTLRSGTEHQLAITNRRF